MSMGGEYSLTWANHKVVQSPDVRGLVGFGHGEEGGNARIGR